jgi:hypothetical protein
VWGIVQKAQKWTTKHTPPSTKSLKFKKCEFSLAHEMHFKHVFNIRGAKSTFGWLDHSGSEPYWDQIKYS